jgi:hypothetical protein
MVDYLKYKQAATTATANAKHRDEVSFFQIQFLLLPMATMHYQFIFPGMVLSLPPV